MRFAYRKTPALKSKPKDQRSIVADVLLQADRPLSLGEIAAEANKARYKERFKRGEPFVTIEESIQWQLDRMVKSGTVKQEAE